MAQFIIRVELKSATSENYDILHQEMFDRKFYRQIQDEVSKTWFHLPQAEYHYKGPIEDRQVIMNMVKEAINKTNKRYEVIVTKSLGTLWDGLEEVAR